MIPQGVRLSGLCVCVNCVCVCGHTLARDSACPHTYTPTHTHGLVRGASWVCGWVGGWMGGWVRAVCVRVRIGFRV